MDKRLLVFFLSLTFTLMGVKFYFNHANTQAYAQQVVATQEQEQTLQEELQQALLQQASFPLASYYLSQDSSQPEGQGILEGDFLLLLSKESNSPSTLYVKKNHQNFAYSLIYKPQLPDSLAIYAPENYKKMPALSQEELENLEGQVIHLLQWEEQIPSVKAFKMLDKQHPVFTHPIESNALAFIQKKDSQGNKELKAIGFFVKDENKLLTFQQLPASHELITSPLNLQASRLQKSHKQEESFYLLETPYQQLVFSSTGASLVEVNLKLQNPETPQSYVKEIEVDRYLNTHQPHLVQFPQKKVFLPSSDGYSPFPALNHSWQGQHYPLLRRPLDNNVSQAPDTHSLNIVSKYPELASMPYEVTYFDASRITFVSTQHHRKITKTFRLPTKDAPYCVELEVQISGDSRNLWLNSGVVEAEIISGSPQPVLKYKTHLKDQKQVQNLVLPDASQEVSFDNLPIDWALTSNGFFGILLDPLQPNVQKIKAKQVDPASLTSRLVKYKEEFQPYQIKQFPGYQVYLPLEETARTQHYRVYLGPFSSKALSAAEKAYASHDNPSPPNYLASQSYHGWFQFISEPIVKLFLFVLRFFHSLTASWAISILLLTLFLRLLLFPLNSWSMKSMRRMQLISPLLQEVQTKYKKNPQKMQMEIMQLYKKHKVNPLSGCFPILIQMPFLIGMFDLLKTSFELRGASFIPGWIDNLTAPDVLFTWGFSLPIFGSELHLLPILSGVVMFIQQKISQAKNPQVKEETEQQKQQKFMMNFMSLFMIVMFYNLPSGLNLYFLFSTLLGIFQQQLINLQNPAQALSTVKK